MSSLASLGLGLRNMQRLLSSSVASTGTTIGSVSGANRLIGLSLWLRDPPLLLSSPPLLPPLVLLPLAVIPVPSLPLLLPLVILLAYFLSSCLTIASQSLSRIKSG